MAPISTPSSEQLIRRFLPLADSIARRFAARWQRVIELDDAVQIARLTLVTKARDVRNPATAPAFLKAHIHGALQHWLRDHSRLVHIPRLAQEACAYAFPFCHSSLDAPSARLRRKTSSLGQQALSVQTHHPGAFSASHSGGTPGTERPCHAGLLQLVERSE